MRRPDRATLLWICAVALFFAAAIAMYVAQSLGVIEPERMGVTQTPSGEVAAPSAIDDVDHPGSGVGAP